MNKIDCKLLTDLALDAREALRLAEGQARRARRLRRHLGGLPIGFVAKYILLKTEKEKKKT